MANTTRTKTVRESVLLTKDEKIQFRKDWDAKVQP